MIIPLIDMTSALGISLTGFTASSLNRVIKSKPIQQQYIIVEDYKKPSNEDLLCFSFEIVNGVKYFSSNFDIETIITRTIKSIFVMFINLLQLPAFDVPWFYVITDAKSTIMQNMFISWPIMVILKSHSTFKLLYSNNFWQQAAKLLVSSAVIIPYKNIMFQAIIHAVNSPKMQ